MMIYGFTHAPFTYIFWYTIGKTIMLWIQPFYWIPIFGVPIPVMKVLHFLLMVVAFFSVRSNLLRKEMNALPIFLPFITFERYAYPAMPLVIIFIANFVEEESDNDHERLKECKGGPAACPGTPKLAFIQNL